MTDPIVETKAGKLRGFWLDGIYTFLGIKYADAKRFQQPTPVKPWDGVVDATNYGYICPTYVNPDPSCELMIPHRFWPADENCQYLNIWTPGIGDGKKRPVLFWMHGGAFSDGSSIEQVAYEGDELAGFGDVVVVTINHRLNILGYLDMSDFGEKYANSVNAGMVDIVAALEWVRDNIAAFGGDPDNVTIFGQSGGGGKAQTLLQTPSAAGLFHKAIIMSGVLPKGRGQSTVNFKALILAMLEELDLKEEEAEELENVPYYFLSRAYEKASQKLGMRVEWGPQPNGWYMGLPLDNPITEYAKTVPTMVGSTIAEFYSGIGTQANTMSDEEILESLREKYGSDTEGIVESFYKTFPEGRLALLASYDDRFRPATVQFAEKKALESTAPTYMYNFAFEFPLMGGVYGWHCSDIPFVFHNTKRVACCNKGEITEILENQMAGAWVSFAYTGNPNHPGMPKWEAYGEKNTTMVFGDNTRCVENFDDELLEKMRLASGRKKEAFPESPKTEKDGEEKKKWAY